MLRRIADFHSFSSLTKCAKIKSQLSIYLSTSAARLQVIKVELDSELEQELTNDEKKPRHHIGINKQKASEIPKRIQKAIIKAVGDYSIKSLVASGEELDRYIKCRKAPMEETNLKQKKKEIEELVLSDPEKFKLPKLSQSSTDDAMKRFHDRKEQIAAQIFKQKVYNWKPILYDEYKSLAYLLGRSTVEFAVIMRIFQEIVKRDTNFKPRSFFDFGSGVGTGVWAAADLWESSIYEYYLVDASRYMNDLSDLILRDGDVNKAMFLRNVNHRQFLPASDDKFDLVLSAYSLFELPSLKNRLEVANNLWNKTGQYLIFVEVGTNSGFTVLNEIRDFLMKVKNVNNEEAFIFSPCPHESPCPRIELDDGTPCNFQVAYNTSKHSGPSSYERDTYSYLVIKKGSAQQESDSWPRLVRTTMMRHKHVICRMCTKDGKIQDGIFTKAKHGKLSYRCAKNSDWGDQLPMKILDSDSPQDDIDDNSK